MENKILEAVKALGGDLANAMQPTCKSKTLRRTDRGRYIITSCYDHNFVCTIKEFEDAAEQWIKEAYMHNAALLCGWNPSDLTGSSIIDKRGVAVFRDGEFSFVGRGHSGILICTTAEFIDYCNANKPCEEVKPEWDGEGLPPVGCKCEVANCGNEWELAKILFVGKEMIVVEHGYGEQHYHLRNVKFRPNKSPRDKAIDEMIELDLWATDKEYVETVYDWLKQLTPEQKKEFGL